MRGTGFATWADIPVFKTGFPNESVTDLLNPTTARRRPIEQSIKPIKTRGLKKADRDADCFFIEPQVVRASLSFAVSRREAGEVLDWSRLTDLTPAAGFQLRGEVSRTNFIAAVCRRGA